MFLVISPSALSSVRIPMIAVAFPADETLVRASWFSLILTMSPRIRERDGTAASCIHASTRRDRGRS